jgi:hypothetical protein
MSGLVKIALILFAFWAPQAFGQQGCPRWAQDELRKLEERSNTAVGNALTEEEFHDALNQAAHEKQRLPSECRSLQDSSR